MPPFRKKKVEAEEDEEANRLKEVLAKYKDRTREKDESAVRAEQDWERFQKISPQESLELGGTEATTHSVKGLDTELLKRQRETLAETDDLKDEKKMSLPPEIEDEVKSDLAKRIMKLLKDPDNIHKHGTDFGEKETDLMRRISKMNPWDQLEGVSPFFQTARYVFRHDSEVPIVVMRSQEEVQDELQRKKRLGLVRARSDPETIQIVKDALRRIKERKKLAKAGKSAVAAQQAASSAHPVLPKAADEDLDIFGDFTVPDVVQGVPDPGISGPVFPLQEAYPEEKVEVKKLTIAPGASKKKREEEDDEFGVQSTEFGKKLDLSKFRVANSQEGKKRRGASDKQLFHQVMKKVDQIKH